MRLIDADKLIKEMSKWYWDKEKQKAAENDASPMDLFTHLAITTVQNQPTVFDLDKVVKQLDNESDRSYANFKEYADNIGIIKDNNMPYVSTDWHYMGLRRAIEIVKGGGVE